VDHTRETERRLAAKLGRSIAPRTPWSQQREIIVATLLDGSSDAIWPPRYAVRRGVWHVLDHAWEIEDKQI
jgi:lambda repressor-like predicted transcriptional regulator